MAFRSWFLPQTAHTFQVRMRRRPQPLEVAIHLERGQPDRVHMRRQGRLHRRSAADQKDLMPAQRPADFQAAEEMTDAEHMLAVECDLHGCAPARRSVEGFGSESISVRPMMRVFLGERPP